MRQRVYNHMLETRGAKYRSFLRYLRIFKYVAMAPKRGAFLESYYVLMRYLDDIVDGDLPLPMGYSSEGGYILDKIEFSRSLINPQDEVDYLMLYCFDVADSFGADFTDETADILNSLLFDAKRRNSMDIFSQSVLEEHFHLLDIRGTIKATLKIFKEDPEKYPILEPLGIACRYQYDIEDINSDLAAGYVNIPLEDIERFGIGQSDLRSPDCPSIYSWLHHRAEEGLKLLDEHHRILPIANFSWLAKATFPPVYENPARKIFKKTIKRYHEFATKLTI
ncbi:MAG: hypothetical protein HKO90_10725 [Flavobacteriaceae bacterium]|nr:hypothetical protein [Flavobacteriaceae bacterium]